MSGGYLRFDLKPITPLYADSGRQRSEVVVDNRERGETAIGVEYVAERYRMGDRIGHGGMAAVYRVFDEVSNKEIALKLLSKGASQSPHLKSMFEHEFHTLAQLAHPRIIEVYDFGVDHKGAYYTMELLDGKDFRNLAPIDFKKACRLLRDVASSLALLHSRRLLHRDISSRNARCTKDGRAKLIDFGAMVPLGCPAKVVGTPAFMAPETVNHQPLDQRTDLFALGALAYWLMTKRYAYRAHTLSHLQDAWRTLPIPLSVIVPEVPKALNDLVMSMLSLDRMSRPYYASEVVETLTACAELEPDDTLEVRQSYLTTPQLVGRAPIVAKLHKTMTSLLGGGGGRTLLFEGPSGMGRSRLLAELVLQSKVIGATVLSASADAGGRQAYGVAWQLLEQLCDSAYDAATEALKPHFGALAEVFSGLEALLRSRRMHRAEETVGFDTVSTGWSPTAPEPALDRLPALGSSMSGKPPGDPVLNRARIQKALVEIFITVSKRRLLVIAVDDIHRVDEPSAAFLSALAYASAQGGMVVAVTAESGAIALAPQAVSLLSQTARRIEVLPLDLEATEALLRSIFGDIANLRLLADRIFAVSKGNPQAIADLAQYLVDKGRVRYQAGTWTVPSSFNAGDLPGSIREALADRANKLSAGALALAKGVALAADEQFSFEECLVLGGLRDAAVMTRQLNELIANEVLVADGSYYKTGHSGWMALLAEALDEKEQQTCHRRLARVFERRSEQHFRVVQHLLSAGQKERALDLFLGQWDSIKKSLADNPASSAAYVRSLPVGWVDTFELLIGACSEMNRPRLHRFKLQILFTRCAALTGTALRSHLNELVAQLYRDCGLDIYDELGDAMGAAERLPRALTLAQARFDKTPEFERVRAPFEAVLALAQTIVMAIGGMVVSNDYQFFDSLPSLEPLFPLSPALGLIQKNLEATKNVIGGRALKARQGWIDVIERMDQSDHAGIDPSTYMYMRLAIVYAVAAIDAIIGAVSATAWIEQIEKDPLFEVNAWILRAFLALSQGDAQRADECKKQVELLQIQNSPPQFFSGSLRWHELLFYAAADDLSRVKQIIADLEEIAERYPGWMPNLHFARGTYHRIRGDYANAMTEFEQALALTAAGRHLVWPFVAGDTIRVLFEQGRLQEARDLGWDFLRKAEAEELEHLCGIIGRPLALVEARLGNEEKAGGLADDAIDRLKASGATGVSLGLAYETRARVAIITEDPKIFRKYAKLCEEQFRAGQNPTLSAKHQKLMEDARQSYFRLSQEFQEASELAKSLYESGDIAVAVESHLAKYTTYQELVSGALDLIIKRTGSVRGYLYLSDKGELKLVAQKSASTLPEELVEATRELFTKYVNDNTRSDLTETATMSTVLHPAFGGAGEYEPVILSASVRGQDVPLGAVLLVWRDRILNRPDDAFYRAVATRLYEAGIKYRGSAQEQGTGSPELNHKSRYVIEELLGEGGMASVFRARDRESGKCVALKRVRVEPLAQQHSVTERDLAERKKVLEATLRREYQTLRSLAHPRIIEAYDFGVDADSPYYTMELLEGVDLRQLAPLEWIEACRLLREIASALALIHSRRLLHRDISPRNVRQTRDGHIKLTDFGALSPMGRPQDWVGTPPFMPPELIFQQPLDQRSDLYSLGALAYWLLTASHAYPVRRVNELKNAWRSRPPSPSELVKKIDTLDEIPDALDRLVMSLLSMDPLGRPSSAAEVMERLSAIAGLPIDDQVSVVQAYLTTPTMVGREKELLSVRKRAIRALRGRGGSVLIEGCEGAGRSRFLDACVLEGKLAGLVVVRADAHDAPSRSYGVAQAVIKRLFAEIPEVVTEAIQPYVSVLGTIIPSQLSDEGQPSRRDRQDVGDHGHHSQMAESERARYQGALLECIRTIGQRRPLMIAIDDFHRIDEPSAAFMSILSHETAKERIALVVTVDTQAQWVSSPAVDLIRQHAFGVEIANLDRDQTEALLLSVFGDGPNVRLLADRIYTISQGNARAIMRLAQHVVDTGRVRYQGGMWLLPDAIEPGDLPASVNDAFKNKLSGLSPEALVCVRPLAFIAEGRLSAEDFLFMCDHQGSDQLMRALNELTAREVLSTDGATYAFSERRWSMVLAEGLTEADRRQAHGAIARLLERRGTDSFILAKHLLQAGQEEKAVEMFAGYFEKFRRKHLETPKVMDEFFNLGTRDWEKTVTALIRACDQLNKPAYYRFNLLYAYVLLSSIIPGRDKTPTLMIIERLKKDVGLTDYFEISDASDPPERLTRALQRAQLRYDASAKEDRFASPAEAIRMLPWMIAATVVYCGTTQDCAFLALMPSLEPLYPLSPAFALVDKNVATTAQLIKGRHQQARQGYMEMLEALARPDHAGLTEALYQRTDPSIRYAIGNIEAGRGLATALTWAEQLDHNPIAAPNAWKIRMLYHLRQGDALKTEACKKKVELLQIQNSPRQYFEGTHVYTESIVYALSDDVLGLKRAIDGIQKMADRFDTWKPFLHFAFGEYHRIRGEVALAIDEQNQALSVAAVGHQGVWPYACAAHIRCLSEAGLLEEACEKGRAYLRQAENEALEYSCNYIRAALALVEAECGAIDEAVALSETVVTDWKSAGVTGINLGFAYETRARVALLMEDDEAFVIYAKRCAEQYRGRDNPALTAKYDNLLQEARKAGVDTRSLEDHDAAKVQIENDQMAYLNVRQRLNACVTSGDRAKEALAVLQQTTGAKEGYLFGLGEAGLVILYSDCGHPVPNTLLTLAQTYLEAEIEDTREATVTAADLNAAEGKSVNFVLDDGAVFDPVVLYGKEQNRLVVTGLAALSKGIHDGRALDPEIVRAISETLLDKGDVVSRCVAQ
jgi:serine/threonine protein kinase